MRRFLLLPLALLGLGTLGLASAEALTAVHQANASLVGVIAHLSPTSITVGQGRHHGLRCRVTTLSPALGSFGTGDRVRIACADGVLVAIADVPARTVKGGNEPMPGSTTTTTATTGAGDANLTYAVGPITALAEGSISVQTMTCTTSPTSTATVGFAVGNLVRMYCRNGVLLALKRTDLPGTTPTTTANTTTTTGTTQSTITGISGTIGTLNATTITVNGGDDGHASLTCTITSASPSTSGFAAGSSVRMYCSNGSLYQLRSNETPPPATTTTTTTTATPALSTITGTSGTIAVLGSATITVNRTDGDGPAVLSCTIGSSSPSTSGFAVGSSVRMYCASGVLYQLRSNTPPVTTTTTATTVTTTTTPTTTTPATTTTTGTPPTDVSTTDGTLSALTATSITVGTLTCTINGSSPSTSGFAVGYSARMYCKTGALYSLIHL